MRLLDLRRLRLDTGTRPVALLAGLLELLLIAAVVVAFEVMPRGRDDTTDLLGVMLLVGLLAALLRAARRGRLPLAGRLLARATFGVRRLVARVVPARTIAFRPPPADAHEADRTPRWLCAVALGVLIAALAWPGGLLASLLFVKQQLSYVVYLLLLGALWTVLGGVTALGLLASARALAVVQGDGRQLDARRLLWLVLLWGSLVFVLAHLPGLLPLLAVAGTGLVYLLPVSRRQAGRYHLWRRDGRGTLRWMHAADYLREHLGLVTLLLLAAVALARGPRLLDPHAAARAFPLTLGLGLAASASALYLVARLGAWVHDVLAPGGSSPEIALVPTVWWPGGHASAPWVAAARRVRFAVMLDATPPAAGFDLVVGRPGDPRAWAPRPGADVGEEVFRLTRRFHVVKRRVFFRRFRSLHKEVTRRGRAPGQGFLFCPHAWPVPGVIRDGASVRRAGLLGDAMVGRPYVQVFEPRLRRYLGGVLRALDLDIVYWEDAVGWSALRAVFGVLFECYDQGRLPVLERHLHGLPGVRLHIQEPEEEERPARPGRPAPLPSLRARVLVVRRERRGDDEGAEAPTPGLARPLPVGAGGA